jgi:putative transposase
VRRGPAALRQAESGTRVAEVIRRMGITEPTFYRWKKQLASMSRAEIRPLKLLGIKSARFKNFVADLTLDTTMLQDVLLMRSPLQRAGADAHFSTDF